MPAEFWWTIRYSGTGGTRVVGSNHRPVSGDTLESGAGSVVSAYNATSGGLDRIDFLNLDSGETSGGLGGNANRIDYASYPIRAGENSVERYIRGKWDFQAGVTNKITGVSFWLSSGDNTSGAAVNFFGKVVTTYAQPVTGTTVIGANHTTWTSATGTNYNLVPTGSPSTPPATAWPITFSGSNTSADRELLSGSYTGGYSNYIVVQLRTTAAATPGNTNGGQAYQFTIQYDEQ